MPCMGIIIGPLFKKDNSPCLKTEKVNEYSTNEHVQQVSRVIINDGVFPAANNETKRHWDVEKP